jgi:uncharacterized membrane protein YuzA (DUF378 family)
MATSTSSTAPFSSTTGAATSLNPIAWLALVLMIVGSINWGLVGVANFDLVAALFGPGSMLSRIVYALVGLAGIYGIALALRLGRRPS